MGKHDRFMQAGRICVVSDGEHKGKLVTVVEIIDQRRAVIDGPLTGVKRQAMNFRLLHMTRIVMNLPHGARTKVVRNQWVKDEISQKWEKTEWAKKLARKALRAAMTDYDRFVVMKAKQRRRAILNAEYGKVKKTYKPKKRKYTKKPQTKA